MWKIKILEHIVSIIIIATSVSVVVAAILGWAFYPAEIRWCINW